MAVDTDELRWLATALDDIDHPPYDAADYCRDAADEIDRLRAAIESHRASSRLPFLNDLPRSGFDSILWSALDEGEE